MDHARRTPKNILGEQLRAKIIVFEVFKSEFNSADIADL
jgi:hypothetical protein